MSEAGLPRTEAVVLLDWYRTLSVSRFWEDWSMSPDPALRDTAARLAGALFGARNDVLEPWMRGRLTAEQAMAQVAPTAGLDPLLALHGLAGSCARMQLVSPQILTRVDQLRAHGIRVGIATDNMDTFTRWTIPALGLDRWFDPILNSADLGALKGDPLDDAGRSPFFGAFLAGLAPDASVFLIDDSAEIATVVEAAGIAFCHVSAPQDARWWLDRLADSLMAAEPGRAHRQRDPGS